MVSILVWIPFSSPSLQVGVPLEKLQGGVVVAVGIWLEQILGELGDLLQVEVIAAWLVEKGATLCFRDLDLNP